MAAGLGHFPAGWAAGLAGAGELADGAWRSVRLKDVKATHEILECTIHSVRIGRDLMR